MDTFEFCPNSQVPTRIPREPTQVISMNGWTFSAKPTVPHVHKFNVKLHGLRWYLTSDGSFDETISTETNARALEIFYDQHETWQPFLWHHPHNGTLTVRFAAPVNIPAGSENGGGYIDPVEVVFIEHDPEY